MANLNKFLTNMLLSGIVTQEAGINYMWHNSFIFFPSKPFASFYKILLSEISPSELKEIFYWLGLLQGKNSTRMLKNRFGFNKDDLEGFINGATIIGMGELSLQDYDKKDFKWGYIKGINSTFALRLKEILPNNKDVLDSYICGILAGGAEVLFEVPCFCKEEKCMAKKDKFCSYNLESNKSHPFTILRKKLKNFNLLDQSISKKYLNKKAFIRISLNKKFSFEEGAFYFNNYEGYNIEVYLVYLLDKILRENYKESYKKALKSLFTDSLDLVLNYKKLKFSNSSLINVLELCKIFGYGDIKIKTSSNKVLFLESKNDVFGIEYKNIFGKSKENISYFISDFLETLFIHIFQKKCSVKEVSCLAKGDSSCTFKLEYS